MGEFYKFGSMTYTVEEAIKKHMGNKVTGVGAAYNSSPGTDNLFIHTLDGKVWEVAVRESKVPRYDTKGLLK